MDYMPGGIDRGDRGKAKRGDALVRAPDGLVGHLDPVAVLREVPARELEILDERLEAVHVIGTAGQGRVAETADMRADVQDNVIGLERIRKAILVEHVDRVERLLIAGPRPEIEGKTHQTSLSAWTFSSGISNTD